MARAATTGEDQENALLEIVKRNWKKIHDHRWESDDGCVVKIDETVQCNTSRPWLPNYRGWMAYGPGKSNFNYLWHRRGNTRFKIITKFKTPEKAMEAIDRHYELQNY